MTDVLSGIVTCEIPGKPVPCPRPRVGRKGTYYPEGYEVWRKGAQVLLRQACIQQNGGRLIEGPVHVEIGFMGAHGSADLDNLIKAVLDAAQGQVFANDRQVAWIDARRSRTGDGWEAGAYVQIRRMSDDEMDA